MSQLYWVSYTDMGIITALIRIKAASGDRGPWTYGAARPIEPPRPQTTCPSKSSDIHLQPHVVWSCCMQYFFTCGFWHSESSNSVCVKAIITCFVTPEKYSPWIHLVQQLESCTEVSYALRGISMFKTSMVRTNFGRYKLNESQLSCRLEFSLLVNWLIIYWCITLIERGRYYKFLFLFLLLF